MIDKKTSAIGGVELHAVRQGTQRPIQEAQRSTWIARAISHVPPGQLGRYLIVGTWNTLFGYGVFAALVTLLDPRVSHGYLLANLLASILNITAAFLGYKWFVFKTKGNYLHEWLRCLAVYSGGIVLGAILLPIAVQLLRYGLGLRRSAPYAGGALLLAFGVIYNFFGHKRFSFQDRACNGSIDR